MITRLDLEEYGKFAKRALEFGPFTVVLGPNEAGKTTVFDALFDALCAESRHESHPAWKNLAGRYGALRKAVLTWEGEPFSFTDEEFLELFAIRAGEASVHAVKGKSWKAVAEARLLNSGLNPAGLASALAAKAKTEKGGSVKAQIAGLRKLIDEHGPALEELRRQRDTIFSGEAETARLDAELKEKAAAAEVQKAELRALNSRIEGLADACRMAAALEGIKALRTLAETEEALGALKNYGRSELPAYRALVAARQERDRAAASAEAALGERRAAGEAARAAAAQLAERDPGLRRQVEKASELSAKLAAFTSAPQKEVLTVLKPMRYGIWGGAAALALFVALSARNLPGYIAALAIAGAGAWVGLRLSIKQTLVGRTPEETKAFLDGLAAEWALVGETPLPAAVEEVYAALAQPAADHAALTEAYNAKAAEIADTEAALAAMAQTAEELKRAATAAAQTAENWLKDRGCAAEDDYQAKVTEHEKLAARAADLRERVKVFMNRHSCSAAETLKDRLYTEREALDRKGVDPAKADEPELERLKQRAGALGKAVHALEAEAAAIDSRLGNARARAEAKLEGLPGRINQLETEQADAAAKILELELQLQAYALAAEVFNKLAEKSTVAFELLAKEVAATLGTVLPGTEARFDSFDAAEAKLKDAGGKLRKIRHLSSGLQDLFMLAARLIMARKARMDAEGKVAPALLVLDEPFYTLDPERERAALQLLGAFQRETGWQMILFTKDEKLARAALAYALQVKIIELK
ncbi:MAG: AAA family ATPase [Elusimicrobiales bacterium]|nr:AAA family ATPase [Elusimicrobiales bacterium]